MKFLQKLSRLLIGLVGLVLGICVATAVFLARQIVNPIRQRIWANPSDLGLPYEEVAFSAKDGLRLAGWFIPTKNDPANAPTLIIVHGWPWNRLGEAAEGFLANVMGSKPVDLLRLAYGLHSDGFNIFMFDLRNHGESADMPPVTFGHQESNDLLGAISYLQGREDVNKDRLGVVGFSMGGNTVLYSLPQTDALKAAVAVQPTTISVFTKRFGFELLGPLVNIVLPLAEALYQWKGGVPFASVRPIDAAAQSNIPLLYVQRNGDKWGSVADVSQMAAVTPKGEGPIFVDTHERYGGYRQVVDNHGMLTTFFNKHL